MRALRGILGLCVLASGALGLGRVATQAGAQQAHKAQVLVPKLMLGAPLQAPHTSKEQALAAAIAEFGSGPFSNPSSVEFGSFTDNNLHRQTKAGLQPVGTVDVWKITAGGLNIPRSCALRAGTRLTQSSCPPAAHTLVVFIEDATGRFLEGQAF